MINVPSLIDMVLKGLNELTENDKRYIKYEIKESRTSRSLYIYKTTQNPYTLNILRISDHLPSMRTLIRSDSPRPSTNE